MNYERKKTMSQTGGLTNWLDCITSMREHGPVMKLEKDHRRTRRQVASISVVVNRKCSTNSNFISKHVMLLNTDTINVQSRLACKTVAV